MATRPRDPAAAPHARVPLHVRHAVALAHPLVERISKFTKVVAIDQQGQGASDADPTAVNPLRVLQVYSAAQIMADSTNALHVKDRKTALSRATGQVQSQTSVVDANRTHGESVLRDGGARNLLQPGTSAVEAAERIGLAGLPLEKVHSALQALESSAFAPPVGGGTVESNATALSSVLNATKTSPPVILVTSKVRPYPRSVSAYDTAHPTPSSPRAPVVSPRTWICVCSAWRCVRVPSATGRRLLSLRGATAARCAESCLSTRCRDLARKLPATRSRLKLPTSSAP